MSNISGSKRRAEAVFTSPTKATASSKRARTYYDYYDEEDVESSLEEEWSDEDMDSESRMSLDDDEWLALGEPIDTRYCKDAPITEITVKPPPASTTRCRCRAKNRDVCVNCTCSTWGYRCQAATCGCQGGPSCSNPFNKLDVQAVFGAAAVELHPCFVSWVLKQRKTRPERITTRYLFETYLEGAAFVEGRHSDGNRQLYRDWRTKWDRLSDPGQPDNNNDNTTTTTDNNDNNDNNKANSSSRVALQQELLRLAFTTSESNRGLFFSFCFRDGWQDSDHTWHCAICGVCMDDGEWHCGKCNECSFESSLQCEGCGGVARRYHENPEGMELGDKDTL